MSNGNCPICSSTSHLTKSMDDYSIHKCTRCLVEYANPMPTEKELSELYSGYRYYSGYDRDMIEFTVMKNAEKNIQYLEKFGLSNETRLLDFGCGENLFVRQGNSPNWFGHDYPHGKIPSGKFDFITLWGVLEHLAQPISILSGLVDRLEKGGRIVITTVSIETDIPYRYRVPIHLFFWTGAAIRELFNQCGLEIEEMENYFMLQNPQFYLDRVLDRGQVPKKIKKLIYIDAKEEVLVPTNEIFIVGKKMK